MKFVIDRKIWLRGEGNDESKLLRPEDGKQCCIGIYLEACGVPREGLKDVPCVTGLDEKIALPEGAEWLSDPDKPERYSSPAALELYEFNDDDYISDAEREAKIAARFSAHGVEVEFV